MGKVSATQPPTQFDQKMFQSLNEIKKQLLTYDIQCQQVAFLFLNIQSGFILSSWSLLPCLPERFADDVEHLRGKAFSDWHSKFHAV